jgi:magnesium-transporting ATPase (P-type)
MDLSVPAHEIIRDKEGNVLQQIPFNSARKRACTILRDPKDAKKIKVFSKGAPEILMDYCSKFFATDGT